MFKYNPVYQFALNLNKTTVREKKTFRTGDIFTPQNVMKNYPSLSLGQKENISGTKGTNKR